MPAQCVKLLLNFHQRTGIRPVLRAFAVVWKFSCLTEDPSKKRVRKKSAKLNFSKFLDCRNCHACWRLTVGIYQCGKQRLENPSNHHHHHLFWAWSSGSRIYCCWSSGSFDIFRWMLRSSLRKSRSSFYSKFSFDICFCFLGREISWRVY